MKIKCFILIVMVISCSDWDTRLILINKTNKKIKALYEVMELDKTIPNINSCEKFNCNDVMPYNQFVLRFHDKWDLYLKKHPEKILRIFIIDDDSLSKYGTCGIFKQQVFKRRFDLAFSDLERLNWKITYVDSLCE